MPVHSHTGHRFSAPRVHCTQVPQDEYNTDNPALAPAFHAFTPLPTSSTTPAISCPGTMGKRTKGKAPRRFFTNEESEALAKIARFALPNSTPIARGSTYAIEKW